MTYDVDYFINKFEAIPEDQWNVGDFYNEERTKFCAAGFCGEDKFNRTEESSSLYIVFAYTGLGDVGEINDGRSELFQQPTPKQRILAALYQIKEMQNAE